MDWFFFSGTSVEHSSKIVYSGSAHLDFILAETWDDGIQRYDLNKDNVWTDVTFDKWDYTDQNQVCHLVAKASTPSTDNPPTGWLFTYPDPWNSYVFLAGLQAVGTQQCTSKNGQVVTELAYPMVMLTTSPNDTGDPPGFQPLGDGKRLTGSSTYIGGDKLIDIEWDLTKF